MGSDADGMMAGGDSQQAIRAEAAAWVVRSRAGEQAAELDAWLDGDDLRADAYLQSLAIWNEIGQIAPDWKADAPPPAPAPTRHRRIMSFASVLCALLIGLACWQALSRDPGYRTAVGEQQIVRLDDGSRVTMNTDTQLAIRFDGKERRVKLVRGEALFDVAHDAGRPFLVSSGPDYVRALGTSFIVRSDPGRLEVTLLSGSVRIGRDGDASSLPLILAPGERYRRTASGPATLDRPRIEAIAAWRNGELILDNTPLVAALAEVNRYDPRPIVLASKGAADLRLSGVFKTGESEAFARTVAAIYGLTVTKSPERLVIAGEVRRRP